MSVCTTDPIEHIAPPTREEFLRDYWKPRRPVIIRGSNTWDDAAWTPQALASRVGGKTVEVRQSPDAVFKIGRTSVKMTFASYVDALLDTGPERERAGYLYMQQLSIRDYLPELLPEIPLPNYIPDPALLFAVNLWVGPAGSVSPLHYDIADNILVQPHGLKRLLLFPPEHLPYLYPDPVEPHTCLVDLTAPDLERFPLLPQARGREVVLAAGEMIFLPAFWCHEVRSEEVSVSVNFWWRPDFRHSLTPAGVQLLSRAYSSSLHSVLRDALDCREFGSLIEMARFAESRHPQAASLLACGAVEEALRLVCAKKGVVASEEVAAIRELRDREVLTDYEAQQLAAWCERRQVTSRDAELFRPSSQRALVDEVRGVLERLSAL